MIETLNFTLKTLNYGNYGILNFPKPQALNPESPKSTKPLDPNPS